MNSSGRCVHRAATLAATAFASVAFMLCTVPSAYAVPPATADETPGADAAIARHDWTGALKELDARIKSNPHDVQAKFKRATILARAGRDDEAITAFTELSHLYPELPEPYNNLAALYAKHGRYDEARVALETAAKANPSYGLAYENLGDLYLRLADASYRRAISLGQASGATRQRLADLQKIVSPDPAPKRTRKATAASGTTGTSPEEYTKRATAGMLNNPVFDFGGPTGSLAIPPYTAPAR